VAYPQPAKRDTLWFYFYLNQPGKVEGEVFTVLGERLVLSSGEMLLAGYMRLPWDIRRVAPGVYFYRVIMSGSGETTRTPLEKCVIIR
jgi:hypothetical protein